jgi:hypothetical protein
MPRQSPAQKQTVERVMHEYKHGELKSGRSGKGGKVKSKRQAIAIAMKESGSSKYESKSENKRNLKKSKRKERSGRTYMQEKESKGSMRSMGKSRSKSTRSKSSRSKKR